MIGPATFETVAQLPKRTSCRASPRSKSNVATLRDTTNEADLLAIGPRDWLFEPGGGLRQRRVRLDRQRLIGSENLGEEGQLSEALEVRDQGREQRQPE